MQESRTENDQEANEAVSCNDTDRPVPDQEVFFRTYHVEHEEEICDEKRCKFAKCF